MGAHHDLHLNLRKKPSGKSPSTAIPWLRFPTGWAFLHTASTSGYVP